MMTRHTDAGIATALFGKTRRAVLGLLFNHAERRYHLREIARLTGVGTGPVQREVTRLAGAGLLLRRREGRQVYYQANRSSPVFAEMRGLLVKTAGLADVLRDCLRALADRLEFAFIYGSMAAGEDRPDSDVDLLLVGDVAFAEAVRALRPARGQLGRELNITVFTAEHFRAKTAEGDPFVSGVLSKPKILLLGDESELNAMAA